MCSLLIKRGFALEMKLPSLRIILYSVQKCVFDHRDYWPNPLIASALLWPLNYKMLFIISCLTSYIKIITPVTILECIVNTFLFSFYPPLIGGITATSSPPSKLISESFSI